MAKRLFFVCAGLVCLALAYHLGASSAQAQSGAANRIRLMSSTGKIAWVVTESDDVYMINGESTASVSHGEGWTKYRLGVLH